MLYSDVDAAKPFKAKFMQKNNAFDLKLSQIYYAVTKLMHLGEKLVQRQKSKQQEEIKRRYDTSTYAYSLLTPLAFNCPD